MELSRRVFSALAGTTVLGLALGGSMSGGTVQASGAPGPVPTGPPPAPPGADGRRHRIAFDRHSLLIDGRRLALWAGELHPFRLPSPSLWRDVLQKMRASGFNAVDVPVAWNQHSPAPGRYDFTGVRDLDLFLRTAAETGLYVVLRPGPHIGADVDAGGLPGWLTSAGDGAGTTGPAFRRHADEWLGRVDAIAARHQYTRGTGTVLLYRLDAPHGDLLSRLRAKVRADGIDVPVLHEGAPVDLAKAPRTADAAEARRVHLTGLADGTALHHAGPVFGGTSWGWLAAPSAPTPTYDPAAAIDEGRRPTDRLAPLHQFGHLLRHVPDLARLDTAPAVRAADARIRVRHLANPDTGAHVYVLRNDSAADVTSTLRMGGTDVPVTVPARDAKLLAAGLDLGGGRKLAHATVQPMMTLSVGRLDIAAFVGRTGEMAHLVLDCPEEPWPTRLDAEAAWAYDKDQLHVTVPLGASGLARVRVRSAGSDRTLLLLFADDAVSLRLWPYETPSGKGLVYGPALLRDAVLDGDTVRLTGDTTDAYGLEVWAPRGITRVSWNGRAVTTTTSLAQSLGTKQPLPGVPDLALPALDGWRRREENPEAEPGYDDSGWTVADRTTSYGTTPVPDEQPVLFADDYGFHYGDVWYRGRLTGAAGLESVSLAYSTGARGMLMAWLDGEPLGTHRLDQEGGEGTWTGTAGFRLPAGLRERLGEEGRSSSPVLSVLVRRTQRGQHDDRAARGLTSVTFGGTSPEVRWRLRGAAAPDPVRGPLNNGGLYGERKGWHLPGYDDGGWESVSLPRADRRQGVTWYRTTFRLDVPPDVDASVGLTLDDDPDRDYRVQVFLNGWNMGEYVAGGAPRTLALPNGILRTRAAANTLALAVLAGDGTEAGPGTARLTLLGSAAGGVPVTPVASPGHQGS
ncbi:beta-galactosidase [Streptomyces sp. SID5910]|uniref:beta-galactosidase n=1 Tax=Streptomyces sp. SID5910 TaxID=2690312 RepID=UPI001F32290B|nr:beta-galactosidase [Streptomyces sp. SID5910]